MASRPKLWPRPRPRPRPRGFGLGLASISLSYYVIGHFSCKNRVKFRYFVNFSGNNLKSYVVNHYLVLFHNYVWPRPRPHSPGLGLEVLASFNITGLCTKFDFCYVCFWCVSAPDPTQELIVLPKHLFKEPTFKGRRKGRVPLYLRILCLDTAVGGKNAVVSCSLPSATATLQLETVVLFGLVSLLAVV